MKKTFIIIIFILSFEAYSQVGIGTTSPNANSKLDINSNSKGFLLPRATILQSNALESYGSSFVNKLAMHLRV